MTSSDPAIRVTGLAKRYRIAKSGRQATRATEAIVERLRHPLSRSQFESFTALDDVSFEVPVGEAVGIIGRNGAGKSTLLKVLTRITAPTAGRIELRGRVGSLLEVGTGFHPELNGRENIYLNGTLLGMTRREIKGKFDEIVDFSGVERFLETPVKRYSSGMYVRLAFAVAAHLETEILAIDEVLAVGDAEFREKSLSKMRSVAQDGRTVLYVSHQMATVSALCTRALYLQSGRLIHDGSVEQALELYQQSFAAVAEQATDPDRRPGSGEVRMTAVRISETTYRVEEPKTISIAVPPAPALHGSYFVSAHINDRNGIIVAKCDSRLGDWWFSHETGQMIRLTLTTPWLRPGRYTVDVFLCRMGVVDAWEGAAVFDVLPELPYAQTFNDEATSGALVLSEFDYEWEAS